MMDIDRFKEINDRYGHIAGDEVIRCFARAIRDSLRHDDLIARYGGEEFVVILPNTGRTVAARVMDRVRAACGSCRFDGVTEPIIVSIGVTICESAATICYSMVMRYFFVKIGSGNSYAAPLLDEGKLDTPAVAGFFRSVTLEEIAARVDDDSVRFSRQAIDLYRWSTGDLDGYGVCVAAGFVWILRPAGPMYEMERDEFEATVGPTTHTDDVPKIVPVHVLYRRRVTHVPGLVAQLTANRHLSSSTFKEISDDFGTVVSIEHVLFKAGIQDRYPAITPDKRNCYHLLQCLGGNELIVLIARILEENGLLVPAPTGGFVKNIDIIAYNDTSRPIVLEEMIVPPRKHFRAGAITVQVRGVVQETRPVRSPETDYIVQINAKPAPGVLNCDWIESRLRTAPASRRWLERVLRWVPFSGQVI